MKNKTFIYSLVGVLLVIGIYLTARKLGKIPAKYDPLSPDKDRPLDLESPNIMGEDVRELQKVLQQMYASAAIEANPGTADGIYGPLTKIAHDSAIRAFSLPDRKLKTIQKEVA